MSFKLLYTNLAGPQGDFLVDPTVTFEAGQVGTLQGAGTASSLPQVTLAGSGSTVTGGTNPAPQGIIDDNKTTQFLATVVGEVIPSGSANLNNANVVSGTLAFTAGAGGTATTAGFSYVNGALAAATTTTGVTVNYGYVIPGKAGDDTTLASGKCTLWLQPGEYATDVYEVASDTAGTAITYTIGAPLYSSVNSKLTSVASAGTGTSAQASVGYVTKVPTNGNPFLHFYKV